ncbi:hypothetical protein Lal_00036606 [Lupinus albus]|nr:hypothetical protein Lal_00036606 [Lupinus albus]
MTYHIFVVFSREGCLRERGHRLPVISRRKMRMTSSHHAPDALGDTRATMAGTKDRSEHTQQTKYYIRDPWYITDTDT